MSSYVGRHWCSARLSSAAPFCSPGWSAANPRCARRRRRLRMVLGYSRHTAPRVTQWRAFARAHRASAAGRTSNVFSASTGMHRTPKTGSSSITCRPTGRHVSGRTACLLSRLQPRILVEAERSKGAAAVRCRQLDGRAAILMVVARPGGCELSDSVRGSSGGWPFTCPGGPRASPSLPSRPQPGRRASRHAIHSAAERRSLYAGCVPEARCC
jgi:hypothetical protein